MNEPGSLAASATHPAAEHEPQPALDWYKDAVIYQLHVRSFFDSKGDGVGDFNGLTEKLDYVASLGVTAVWLLPFYPSPLRDEGYDIADYYGVNPMYGTLDDFRRFLAKAHTLGLRVITELVINHTSDQHPWFQRARRAEKGSPDREFYVWSDTADRYPEVRVIFQDYEPSNWTWDMVARQHYWHRFYSHQPDLNFDHPPVRQAVLDVVDFWFDMGVDGMRLDAVPYLYERDGTNCESLPETHDFLKLLRTHVNKRHPGKMLLAEANQWPEDTAAYFGDDDGCHMCFNFPLMPRLFMAIQQEERFPVVDIVEHTPSPPPSGQWAVFLRNHDELTLEMVTDEERDAMYRFYALDPKAKVNLGLRRRLAPLLRNDRRRLELMHAPLFSMPGTPVMYYGDEIRMGDNIYLHDRDSVRTPMQWSPDRNGGFSRANPQRLFLSPITDPQFHFLSCNVETEEQSPHSLLWWLRRVLHLRRRYRAFGRGTIEFLLPKNPHILVFLRRHGDETLLAVFNLSRSAQFVELDLAAFRGRTPVELFAETRFPMIGELPYLLTVGPHGFYWFRLDWPKGEEARRGPADLPAVLVDGAWTDAFRRPTIDGLQGSLRDYLRRQAWHVAPQSAVIRSVEVVAVAPLAEADDDGSTFAVVLVRVHYVAGESALYQLTLVATPRARAEDILRDRPTAGVFRTFLRQAAATWYVCDASAERGFWTRWSKLMADAGAIAASDGRLEFQPLAGYAPPDAGAIAPVRRHGAAGGNAAASAGPYFFTVLRHVEAGIHPEVEIGTLAHDRGAALPVPKLRGTCRFRRTDLGAIALGTVDDFVPYDQPLSDVSRDEIRRGLELVSAEPKGDATGMPPSAAESTDAATHAGTAALRSRMQALSALLGGRLAEAHLAVAGLADVPAFAPDVVSSHYRQSLYFGFRAQAVRTFAALRAFADRTSDLCEAAEIRELIDGADRAERRFETLLNPTAPLLRIRCHRAFRLDDALLHGGDVVIASWGGHSDRSLTDRRIKRVALVDLAAAAQSFTNIVFDSLADWRSKVRLSAEATENARCWTDACRTTCLAAFTAAYRSAVVGQRLVPDNDREFDELFLAFRLQAAVSELDRALNHASIDAIRSAVAACRELLP